MNAATPPFGFRSSRARVVSANLLVAVACAAAAVLGGWFALGHLNVAWPAAGVSLAIVFRFGPIFLPGVAAGAFAGELWLGGSAGAALAIAVGNTAEAAFAGWLAQRLALNVAWNRRRDVVGMLFVTVAAPLPAALIGTAALLLGGGHTGAEFGRKLLAWWIGDSVGILVFAPLVLGLGLSAWHLSVARLSRAAGLLAIHAALAWQIGRAHV